MVVIAILAGCSALGKHSGSAAEETAAKLWGVETPGECQSNFEKLATSAFAEDIPCDYLLESLKPGIEVSSWEADLEGADADERFGWGGPVVLGDAVIDGSTPGTVWLSLQESDDGWLVNDLELQGSANAERSEERENSEQQSFDGAQGPLSQEAATAVVELYYEFHGERACAVRQSLLSQAALDAWPEKVQRLGMEPPDHCFWLHDDVITGPADLNPQFRADPEITEFGSFEGRQDVLTGALLGGDDGMNHWSMVLENGTPKIDEQGGSDGSGGLIWTTP